jgi:hypothetical protein
MYVLLIEVYSNVNNIDIWIIKETLYVISRDLATEGLHIPAVTMANRLLKLFETLIHVQDEMKYNQKR